MNDKYYVYEWYIVDTGEVFYVGKGCGDRYKSLRSRNSYFICMYKSHDCDVRIKFNDLTENEAFKKEKELIKWYRDNTNFRLTNQTDGGEGASGWKPSKKIKDKMSRSSKAKWADPNYRDRIIASRHLPDSTYQSKEFKEKISKIVSGENNPNFKHYWTEYQKDLLRQKQRNNPVYKNENNPNAKKIICIETGEIFDCIKYALVQYGIKDETSMSIALKQKNRTAGGLHWAEYNEDLLDKNQRFEYLCEVLAHDTTRHAIKCLEDNTIFRSMTDLSKELNITTNKIRYHLFGSNHQLFYNNKTYILLK